MELVSLQIDGVIVMCFPAQIYLGMRVSCTYITDYSHSTSHSDAYSTSHSDACFPGILFPHHFYADFDADLQRSS